MSQELPDNLVQRVADDFGADLLRFLRRRVRNRADAGDVAQEAYIRLLRFDRKDLIRDPQAYVYRLAGNLIHELELKRRTDDDRLVRWTRERELDDPLTPESIAEAGALRARIESALDQLSPRSRAVVILHRREGLTYEEIGERLKISPSMVKKHLARGLRHCRALLRDLV